VGKLALRSAIRHGLVACAILTLAAAPHARAEQATEPVAATAPARIVLIAAECESKLLDIGALAAALRVELVQEGVADVQVAAPGASVAPHLSTATIRLRSVPCDERASALGFEIEDASTGRTVGSSLPIADVEPKVRPRVAALVIAERLRASWPGLVTQPPPVPTPPPSSATQGMVPLAEPPRWRVTAPQPPSRTNAGAFGLTLGAGFEFRIFSGLTTSVLGPRAVLFLPARGVIPLRVHVDAGVAFGVARDVLGDISLTLASGGVGLALIGGAGAMHFELGPKAELGWLSAKGTPSGLSVRGATADAALITASVLASVWANVARGWRTAAALDVGAALTGLEARADGRPVADLGGPMLGARATVAYEF
jgi:hypothetical protein